MNFIRFQHIQILSFYFILIFTSFSLIYRHQQMWFLGTAGLYTDWFADNLLYLCGASIYLIIPVCIGVLIQGLCGYVPEIPSKFYAVFYALFMLNLNFQLNLVDAFFPSIANMLSSALFTEQRYTIHKDQYWQDSSKTYLGSGPLYKWLFGGSSTKATTRSSLLLFAATSVLLLLLQIMLVSKDRVKKIFVSSGPQEIFRPAIKTKHNLKELLDEISPASSSHDYHNDNKSSNGIHNTDHHDARWQSNSHRNSNVSVTEPYREPTAASSPTYANNKDAGVHKEIARELANKDTNRNISITKNSTITYANTGAQSTRVPTSVKSTVQAKPASTVETSASSSRSKTHSEAAIATIKLPNAAKGWKDLTEINLLPDTNTISNFMDANRLANTNAEQAIGSDLDLLEKHAALSNLLQKFDIPAVIEKIHIGPALYLFQLHMVSATKIQKIKQLSENISIALKSKSIRLLTPIEGTDKIGVEVPKKNPAKVMFNDMLKYYQSTFAEDDILTFASKVPMLVGLDAKGSPIIIDVTTTPHMIIAGATGAGKSMSIHVLISSIISCCNPHWTRLILIDPKRVELSLYQTAPHLLSDVITDLTEATTALEWLDEEMQRRYVVLQKQKLRNINDYYDLMFKKDKLHLVDMPKIICIIDEFADLILQDKERVEKAITKLSRLSRAVGIHLVMATQRPSRDVITGALKANCPTKMAFRVSNKVNSQIILDDGSATSLTGKGDMILDMPGTMHMKRIQGCMITDEFIKKVLRFSKKQFEEDFERENFKDEVIIISNGSDNQQLFEKATSLAAENGYISASLLQRQLKVGYQKAASLLDQLITNKVVSQNKNSNRVHDFIKQS